MSNNIYYTRILISILIVYITTADFNDDDDLVQTDIKIPFCRKGHSLSTGFILNDTSKQLELNVLLFGGEGINYNDQTETFLKDVWSLKLTESKGSGQPFDFNWNLIDNRLYPYSAGSTDDFTTYNYTYQAIQWPERRSNFGSASASSGLVIYGGENNQRLLQSRVDTFNPFYGDMWIFVTGSKFWIPLHQTVRYNLPGVTQNPPPPHLLKQNRKETKPNQGACMRTPRTEILSILDTEKTRY